jgi:hypothetical protein
MSTISRSSHGIDGVESKAVYDEELNEYFLTRSNSFEVHAIHPDAVKELVSLFNHIQTLKNVSEGHHKNG